MRHPVWEKVALQFNVPVLWDDSLNSCSDTRLHHMVCQLPGNSFLSNIQWDVGGRGGHPVFCIFFSSLVSSNNVLSANNSVLSLVTCYMFHSRIYLNLAPVYGPLEINLYFVHFYIKSKTLPWIDCVHVTSQKKHKLHMMSSQLV